MQFGAVFFVFEVLYFGVCLAILGCVFGILESVFGEFFLYSRLFILECVPLFWGVYLVFGGMKLVFEGVHWYWVFVFHMWGCVFVFCACIFQKNPKVQMLSKI